MILVSKDINLRIKAAILGATAEDYFNDRALDDLSLLYQGMRLEEESFWERYPDMDSWTENGITHYRIKRVEGDDWFPNQCLAIGSGDGVEAIVREVTEQDVVLKLVNDFQCGRRNVWGIQARNREQNFALNLLTDPQIDFVTLMGMAGTGKTLLTLAAGLAQTLDEKRYSEIIVTRATVVHWRGHRLSARHGRRKDDPVDGRPDG